MKHIPSNFILERTIKWQSGQPRLMARGRMCVSVPHAICMARWQLIKQKQLVLAGSAHNDEMPDGDIRDGARKVIPKLDAHWLGLAVKTTYLGDGGGGLGGPGGLGGGGLGGGGLHETKSTHMFRPPFLSAGSEYGASERSRQQQGAPTTWRW